MNDNERRALQYLRRGNTGSAEEIGKATGLCRNSAVYCLNKLLDSGLVRRVESKAKCGRRYDWYAREVPNFFVDEGEFEPELPDPSTEGLPIVPRAIARRSALEKAWGGAA